MKRWVRSQGCKSQHTCTDGGLGKSVPPHRAWCSVLSLSVTTQSETVCVCILIAGRKLGPFVPWMCCFFAINVHIDQENQENNQSIILIHSVHPTNKSAKRGSQSLTSSLSLQSTPSSSWQRPARGSQWCSSKKQKTLFDCGVMATPGSDHITW